MLRPKRIGLPPLSPPLTTNPTHHQQQTLTKYIKRLMLTGNICWRHLVFWCRQHCFPALVNYRLSPMNLQPRLVIAEALSIDATGLSYVFIITLGLSNKHTSHGWKNCFSSTYNIPVVCAERQYQASPSGNLAWTKHERQLILYDDNCFWRVLSVKDWLDWYYPFKDTELIKDVTNYLFILWIICSYQSCFLWL